jgi:hypothetical protein
LDSENCSCPLSQKRVQKRFLPQKGVAFLWGAFVQKNFQVREKILLSALEGPPMSSMGRREFITLLGGAAAAWPLAAHAQQPGERIRRVGVLMGGAETDVESPARVKVFQEAPETLGWIVGRNLQIDYRWTMADAERTQVGSMELLRLVPGARRRRQQLRIALPWR